MNKDDKTVSKSTVDKLAGASALIYTVNAMNGRQRKKLMNDILYYLRKLMRLARQAQSISEGTEIDEEDSRMFTEMNKIGEEIERLASRYEE